MSKSGQEHWLDRYFKKRLDQYELKPNDAVWENIARHLDGEKRRPFLLGNWLSWLWALIFIAVVAGLVAFLWFNTQKQKSIQPKHPMDLPDQNRGNEDKGTASMLIDLKTKQPQLNAARAIPVSSNTAAPIHQTQQVVSSKKISLKEEVGSFKNNNSRNVETATAETEFSGILDNTQTVTGQNQVVENDFTNLIVSSDPYFLGNIFNTQTTGVTNKLPGVQNLLTTKSTKRDLATLAEGCLVYEDNKAHFFVDAYYAPELAKRSFSVSDPNMLSYAEKRANTEKPILSYTAGFRGSVVFSNGLAFRTGLQYSNNSERFDYVKETVTITIERKDKDGNVIGIETQVNEIMDQSYNHFKSFDIPFILGYEKDLKDFILSLNGGIGFNLSTRHSGKIYQADQKTIYNLNDSGEGSNIIYKTKAGLSFISSLGLNYKYNERIMLMLEPSARFYLNSITEEAYPVQQKYVFFGLNVGLRYRVF